MNWKLKSFAGSFSMSMSTVVKGWVSNFKPFSLIWTCTGWKSVGGRFFENYRQVYLTSCNLIAFGKHVCMNINSKGCCFTPLSHPPVWISVHCNDRLHLRAKNRYSRTFVHSSSSRTLSSSPWSCIFSRTACSGTPTSNILKKWSYIGLLRRRSWPPEGLDSAGFVSGTEAWFTSYSKNVWFFTKWESRKIVLEFWRKINTLTDFETRTQDWERIA